MLTVLHLNPNKVKWYNQRMQELRSKLSDNDIDAEKVFPKVNQLSDKFPLYSDFQACLKDNDILIIQDDYREEFKGVYIGDLNSDYVIEYLTDFKAVENYDSTIYWESYGVADNASQVLDYYDSLCREYSDYVKGKEFIIILTPIFKDSQPSNGGWRWCKWGQYIGKFESRCEYLYDEVGIDFVYCFKIIEVEKSDNDNITC